MKLAGQSLSSPARATGSGSRSRTRSRRAALRSAAWPVPAARSIRRVPPARWRGTSDRGTADVTREADIEAAVRATMEQWGRLDIVILTPAPGTRQGAGDDRTDWDLLIDLNLKARSSRSNTPCPGSSSNAGERSSASTRSVDWWVCRTPPRTPRASGDCAVCSSRWRSRSSLARRALSLVYPHNINSDKRKLDPDSAERNHNLDPKRWRRSWHSFARLLITSDRNRDDPAARAGIRRSPANPEARRCRMGLVPLRGGGSGMELSFPECRKCNDGVLLPLSDYGRGWRPITYKAWVCSNPACGFNIRIDNGEITSGAASGLGQIARPRRSMLRVPRGGPV